MHEFTPRLWQHFRYLANPERLNVFRAVCLAPEKAGLNVSTTTRMVNLQQPATSIYLRQLASCGLLVARRDKRFLFYSIQNQPQPDGSDILAQGLCRWFVEAAELRHDWGTTCPPAPFQSSIPAFANRLRVVILKCLSEGRAETAESVFRATLIPETCCQYHLDLLVRHGMAIQLADLCYRFVSPAKDLVKLFTILSLAEDPNLLRAI